MQQRPFDFLYNGVEKEPATDGTSAFARGPDGTLIGTGTTGGDWATLENLHGDVVAAFTTNGASLTDSRSYDPFGQPTTPANPDLSVGFQGSWIDPNTGLVNAQARWYNPATGTFLSRDTYPLPWTGTAADNRYTYAAANPTTLTDPTGQRIPDDDIRAAEAETVPGTNVHYNCNNANGTCVPANLPPPSPRTRPGPRTRPRANAFWAGVAAAVAFKKAYQAKYPGLSDEAYNQMVALGPNGDDKFWAGVNAELANRAATQAVLDLVKLTEQWEWEQRAAAAAAERAAAVHDLVSLTEEWEWQQRAAATSNAATPAQLAEYADALGTAPAHSGDRQVCGTRAGAQQCVREYDMPQWLFEMGWGHCDFTKYGYCYDSDQNHFNKYYDEWAFKDCHGTAQCTASFAAGVLLPIPGAPVAKVGKAGTGAKAVFRVLLNKKIGDAAADAIAARYPGAMREVTLQAASGARRIDVLTPEGLAIESKVGRTGLNSRTRQEIARDVELLNDPNSPVVKLMWEFSVSPTTGRGGPTPELTTRC